MPPLRIAIVGASGSGKTRLIQRLVPIFKRRGLRVGTLKHAHGGFDLDIRRKDSARHFEAGADVTLVTGPGRSAVFLRHSGPLAPKRLWEPFRDCDLVLVEGFRTRGLDRIEVFRKSVSPVPLFRREGFRVRAVVTRDPLAIRLPIFDPRSPTSIADFILGLHGPS